MTLEKQVVSLDLAKRLKELGFKQESLFYWLVRESKLESTEYWITKRVVYNPSKGELYDVEFDTERRNWYSAYTVAELGEMLPEGFVYHTRIMNTNLGKRRIYLDFQELKSGQPQGKVWKGNIVSNTEADARAKMLIYLKENNLI